MANYCDLSIAPILVTTWIHLLQSNLRHFLNSSTCGDIIRDSAVGSALQLLSVRGRLSYP